MLGTKSENSERRALGLHSHHQAQDVYSGKTFSHPYSHGNHGLVVLPSNPISFTVDSPGTSVFYRNLINTPESYPYSATGCVPATNCSSADLLAVEVVPTYAVTISDQGAPVPSTHEPVPVPLRIKPDGAGGPPQGGYPPPFGFPPIFLENGGTKGGRPNSSGSSEAKADNARPSPGSLNIRNHL